MQPQVIRAFSHLPEAKAVFNATNDALAYLEVDTCVGLWPGSGEVLTLVG